MTKRWPLLAVIFLSAFAFLFSMQAAPPLLPAIMQEFHLDYAGTATVMLFVALPALFLSIPGGLLADRLGKKRTSVIGLAMVSIGTVMTALSPSFGFLQAGRAVVGVGGALAFSAAPGLIFQWFTGKELGVAMGIWSLNMPLAVVVSFNTLNHVSAAYGWRGSFWVAAILAIVILVVFAVFAREKKEAPAVFSLKPLRRPGMWVLALVWAAFNMAVLSLTTWGQTLFTDFKGIQTVQADFLAGLVMLISFTTPLTGYLMGRLGRRRVLILIATVGMTVMFALMPRVNGGSLVLVLVATGLFMALAPPAIFALPPELVGPENTGLGFGVLNTALNLAVVIGPLIVGRVLDVTHSQGPVFFTIAGFAALGIVFTLRLKAK